MIRRAKDNLIPELKDMDKPKKAEPSPIRKGVTPHQNKLSVQDVRDYSTPAGASMANEEMRRLRLYVNEVSDKVDTKSAGSPTSNTPTKIITTTTPEMDSKPDSFGAVDNGLLSVKHNNVIVGEPKHIESLNYLDYDIGEYKKDYIGFNLFASVLEQNLTSDYTINNKRQVNIEAFVKRKVKTGIVEVNTMPTISEFSYDSWKSNGLYYTPQYGYYGWYVYGVIELPWALEDPNDYAITLVDLHKITIDDIADEILKPEILDWLNMTGADMSNASEVESRIYDYYHSLYAANHELEVQMFIPEHEGMKIKKIIDGYLMTQNIIIVRGVYKPELPNYYGYGYSSQSIEHIDESHIRTNLIYHYMIEVK